jgi:adenylate kinase family enzyme
MIQIGILGSHGTGKTTLANKFIELQHHLGRKGFMTDDGCSRAIKKKGFKINQSGSYVTQIEISKELVDRFKPNSLNEDKVCHCSFVIRVSTVARMYAYLKYITEYTQTNYTANKVNIAVRDMLHNWAIYELCTSLNEIIFLPIEFGIDDDGVRSTDEEYQKIIDKYLIELLEEAGCNYRILRGDIDTRVKMLKEIMFKYFIRS